MLGSWRGAGTKRAAPAAISFDGREHELNQVRSTVRPSMRRTQCGQLAAVRRE